MVRCMVVSCSDTSVKCNTDWARDKKCDAPQMLAAFAHFAGRESKLAALTTELERAIQKTSQPGAACKKL